MSHAEFAAREAASITAVYADAVNQAWEVYHLIRAVRLGRSPEYIREVAAALGDNRFDLKLLVAAADCRAQLDLLLEGVPATPVKLSE
jgi:hypothetical protein